MKKINTKILIGGFIGVVVLLLVVSRIVSGPPGIVINNGVGGVVAGGAVEQAAPDFTLQKLGGDTITLSDYKGEKAVVLDFFATWCPNCRRDMPKLSKMYEKYKDEIEVIGVNLQEPESKVQDFISDFGISFPIVMDPGSQTSRAYGVRYTNYHVLINKEGEITGFVPGDISESQLKTLIQ